MAHNHTRQFITHFQMLEVHPPQISHFLPIDLTAYATSRQIILQTQYDQDQDSIQLNKMASKLIRLLDEGQQKGFSKKDEKQCGILDQSKKIVKDSSPLRVQIFLEDEEDLKTNEITNPTIKNRTPQTQRRSLTPKRESFYPNKFKDENQNYGNKQQRQRKHEKKIVELLRVEYRKQIPQIKPFQPQEKRIEDEEPARIKKMEKNSLVENKHKKTHSALPVNSKKNNAEQTGRVRKAILRNEKPINLPQRVEANNSYNYGSDSRREEEFLHRLKDQFSSICCNELNEEEKKVSEELRVLEMRLGEIVGNQTPYRNPEGPKISPCHSNQDLSSISNQPRTVRVNLTPTRGNQQREKSPMPRTSQLLSKRLEKAMRV